MPLFEWSDRPATKKDLITHLVTLGIAMWLVDSGKGMEALDEVKSKVRGLIGAAPAEKAPEPEKKG